MTTEKSVLYSGKKLIITLVDEGTSAHITIQSTKNGPDLFNDDDVIVIIDSQGIPVTTIDRQHARCDIPEWETLIETGFQLMIRVDEFYSSWDFGDMIDEEDEDYVASSES
mgnify:CR=1 FL=1